MSTYEAPQSLYHHVFCVLLRFLTDLTAYLEARPTGSFNLSASVWLPVFISVPTRNTSRRTDMFVYCLFFTGTQL